MQSSVSSSDRSAVHRFSLLPAARLAVAYRRLDGGQRKLQSITQGGGGAHLADIGAKLDQCPCHAWRNARDDAIAAHQPGCLGDPDEIVGDRGVDCGPAGNLHYENPCLATRW